MNTYMILDRSLLLRDEMPMSAFGRAELKEYLGSAAKLLRDKLSTLTCPISAGEQRELYFLLDTLIDGYETLAALDKDE